MKSIRKILSLFFGILLIGLTGCQKNWLDEQPLTELSEASFWKTENDVKLALTGLYQASSIGNNTYSDFLVCLLSATDDSEYKDAALGTAYSGYFQIPTDPTIQEPWSIGYKSIYRVNYFLANIDKVNMDATKKAQFIAEARFIRANEYFWMLQWWGGIPLVTKTLTIAEANTQTRNSRQEIVDFCLTEFTEAAADLPASPADSEKGRILKAAALAQEGRLLMIEKRWSEAATAFKEIIDLNVHIIDPRYKKLFEAEGETSKEIILSSNFIAGLFGNPQAQLNFHPEFYGGYNELNAFQNLIDAFLMNDGLPIEESPLYDPDHPFDNRDPRLYASVFLPQYTVFNGTLYLWDPTLTDIGNVKSHTGATGYSCKKYVTENYVGDQQSSGDDIIYIRYAEVLLGYLESKLEAGDNITQDLLDQTINQLRGRAEVNMPPVTETDQTKLREIVRRERRVEFCWERYTRWMDIHRWGIASQVINNKFYGMQLINDPANSSYTTDATGHVLILDRTGTYVEPKDELWPLPQSEININPNLGQNPGYSK
jgi:hypothetical protein